MSRSMGVRNIKVTVSYLMSLVVLLFVTACSGGDGNSSLNGQEDGDNQLQNQSPVANASTDQKVNENTTVTLNGSGTDSDGSISSYSWKQTSGTSVVMTDADKAIASFIAPEVTVTEVLVFELTVTDNDGVTAKDTVRITVENIAPSQSIVSKSFVYDAYGRVTEESLGNGKAIQYSYDDNGNLIKQTVVE